MVGGEGGLARKQEYFMKLSQLLEEYPKCFVVGVDNVSSNQMQKIRQSLRGRAVVLMGKNTLIRKVMRAKLPENPQLEKLMTVIRGNVGFVFTKDDLIEVRDVIMENKLPAPARAGALAPTDVIVPAQNTGLDPSQTSFMQALNIPTKISRGTIEILSDVHLIKSGSKVGASEANLLGKLNIRPFFYGLAVSHVYDNGALYDPAVLDLKDDDLLASFMKGVNNIASVCLEIGYPTLASLPHSMINGIKNVFAVSLATDYEIPQVEKIKEYLENPEAFAVAAPVAAEAAPAEEVKEEAKEEDEEEEDDDMGFGLFD